MAAKNRAYWNSLLIQGYKITQSDWVDIVDTFFALLNDDIIDIKTNELQPSKFLKADTFGGVEWGEDPSKAEETAFAPTLSFDLQWQVRQHDQIADITYLLNGSGNLTNTVIEDIVTGNGVNTIIFPAGWYNTNSGVFDVDKVNAIIFYYDLNGRVRYTIENLETITVFKLLTPSNVAANPLSSTSNKITWDAVANASSYDVEDSADGVLFALLGNTAGLFFDDTGLSTGVEVFYRVKAIGDGITYTDSDYSAIVSATPGVVPVWTDDFVGTVIDAAFTVINGSNPNVDIYQNDGLFFDTLSINSAFGNDVVIRPFSTSIICLAFTIARSGTIGAFNIGLVEDLDYANDRIVVYAVDSSAKLLVVQGGVAVYDNDPSINISNRFKILYDTTTDDIKFYYWNSSWVQIGTTQNYNFAGSLEFLALGKANAGGTSTHELTELDYYDQDIITRR